MNLFITPILVFGFLLATPTQSYVRQDNLGFKKARVQTISKTTAPQIEPKVQEAEIVQPPQPAPVQTASNAPSISIVAGCGDNEYANFIYMHESGCNLNAVNAGGCRGIGQACPGSKLPCGADYACQNAWFSAYAEKYGGWAGAYAFWIQNRWW